MQQSQHWIDKLVKGIFSWQEKTHIDHLHVDDMKTPSGRVHTGALRGVMLHDIVAKALTAASDQTITSTYVFNDMDSMDGLPSYLDEKEYSQHMGKPLYKIPAPPLEKSGIDFVGATEVEKAKYQAAKNFAEFYALDFIDAFHKLGSTQQIIWSHELYESGQMNEHIQTALDNIDTIRRVYQEVADYQLPKQWFPFQVICPQCGKLGTTLTTGWDGRMVTFECQKNKVTWAEGCGYSGSVSPFNGTGKLLWKVDWPAHWKCLGVTIEGAGKDHTSAGGSRDMANQLIDKVFHAPVPFDIPYEWILIRGAKMSSSKGVGTSAREFVELFPAEVGRFLFVSRLFSQVIDFDPHTMAIPNLFDDYDAGARTYWGQLEEDSRAGRSFELSQIENIPSAHFLPRFRDVATWMQYPEIDLVAKFAEIKGSALTAQEKAVLAQRKHYAQIWINRYAPEEFQLGPTLEIPELAYTLTNEQKKYLEEIEVLMKPKEWNAADLQQALFELAKQSLGARKGFEAIYIAYLGKKAGPRAAWLLLSMTAEFRHKRIAELSLSSTSKTPTHSVGFISQEVHEQFPGMFFAQVLIKNVTIRKTEPKLEALKKEVTQALNLPTENIGQLKPIEAYRKLFKATGVDFHKKRPSPEALLRRISQGKTLYTINTAVDAYNLAVIETAIGLGGFDADMLKFPVTLRFSKEGESLLLLGDETPTFTRAGELVYSDQEKLITIDLNYRDISNTKITEKTKNILLFADGAPGLSKDEVVAALQRGASYIQQFCGGEVGKIEVKE